MGPGVCIARAASLLAALAYAAAGCSSGKTVVLGSSSPVLYHFDAPVLLTELASPSRTDNPTLTGDLLEIYFTTDRASGNGDVWFATRPSPTAPFGTPAAVTAVNGDSFETSSAISADGLTLWFGSDRAGGAGANDIWVSQRPSRDAPWSTPVNVVALNGPDDDIPRPPGQHALVMPMASTKVTAANPASANYQTYLAARATTGAPFGAPVAIPELDYPDRSTVDGFLTDDGLTIFFSSAPVAEAADAGAPPIDAGKPADGGAPNSDLFVAWRLSTSESFSLTQPLSDLNTAADERDPWLSPDGTTLYFTSDRGGALNIYTAQVQPR
jgi:WD40 repeat protein